MNTTAIAQAIAVGKELTGSRPWVWLHNADQPRRHDSTDAPPGTMTCLGALFVIDTGPRGAWYACSRCDYWLGVTIRQIHRLLQDVYTLSGIRIWLTSRNRNLGLQSPIDLLLAKQPEPVLREAHRLSQI